MNSIKIYCVKTVLQRSLKKQLIQLSVLFINTQVLSLCLCSPLIWAQEIWSESPIEFSKTSFADPSLAVNQDRITNIIWITRENTRGIYNAFSESSHNQNTSPSGTRWAFSGLNGNPSGTTFSANEYTNLIFDNWVDSLGGQGFLQGNILNRHGVVHLIDDDIYIDIVFTEWGAGFGGGGFTYTRATAPMTTADEANVPVPFYAVCLFGLCSTLIAKHTIKYKNY